MSLCGVIYEVSLWWHWPCSSCYYKKVTAGPQQWREMLPRGAFTKGDATVFRGKDAFSSEEGAGW